MIKVQRVYYYEYNHYTDEKGQEYCECDITTDEVMAKLMNGRLAKLIEVEEFIGMGYDVIPILEVQEGIYGWVEIEYITEFDEVEIFQGYTYLQPNSDWEIKDMSRLISILSE